MEKTIENNDILTKAHSNIFNRIITKIKELFQLEEVEITFNEKNNYTYTILSHRHNS